MVELGLTFKNSGLDLDHKIWQSAHFCRRDDRIVDFCYPILSWFWKMISVSNPNPVLVKIILSVSEDYPELYYDAQHTFLCSVYFALWGKITVEVVLPVAEHDWLQWSHDKFGTHVLLSWPWHLQQLSPRCMDKCCNGFKAGKQLAVSCLR